MCPETRKPASCEIRAVICFLHNKNMSADEIHPTLLLVYGHNVMSEGTVRQWCTIFKEDRRTNVHSKRAK
jgi:hypothetical protein